MVRRGGIVPGLNFKMAAGVLEGSCLCNLLSFLDTLLLNDAFLNTGRVTVGRGNVGWVLVTATGYYDVLDSHRCSIRLSTGLCSLSHS